ncbi:MAG: class I SAM-dependent methyltransferase [Acidobacteriota bacterium]|nr:class I SAM-dependent methyltransferase [Acidobacteriota bacterium]
MTELLEGLLAKLDRSLAGRTSLFDARHEAAFRLFNGFAEGWSALAVDLYAQTLILHDYAEAPEQSQAMIATAQQFYQSRLPWINAVLLKTRHATDAEMRKGKLLVGTTLARKVREHEVWYSVDLQMNRDASLYLDTRNLRAWILGNPGGQRVLNTFAYTGSLGVAAQAAGATRVVHLDLNRRFLNVAKASYTLNGFPIHKPDFQTGDFWPQISRMIRSGEQFDCVLLDPPFFAATSKGIVDMEKNYARLINKVRPLIADGGTLVAVNNALFVSGAEYLRSLETLCADGYLTIEELIPVAEDFTGYDTTRVASSLTTDITDFAPFNHSTKIAVLRVRRKDAMNRPDLLASKLG